MTIARADAELVPANTQLRKEAGAFAEAYEQYLTRSVGQMDQVTMQLKHSGEPTRSPSFLGDLKRDGMVTDRAYVAVSVFDRHGVARSSTRHDTPVLNLARHFSTCTKITAPRR
ncbi:MAG: hypothetical protein H7335_10865 [Massilia sp.]|nr:hypothetical protein [Massilia sp.]